MKEFVVLYREQEAQAQEAPLLFQCHADDIYHAKEQCLNAYPGCDILRIVATRCDFQYKRVHLPTGSTHIGTFNGSHHECFSEPKAYPERFIQKTIDSLIKSWNRQQKDTWLYARHSDTEVQSYAIGFLDVKTGTAQYYTGKAGDDWLTPNIGCAFFAYSFEGATNIGKKMERLFSRKTTAIPITNTLLLSKAT